MKRKTSERLESILFTLPSIVMVTLVIYIPFVLSGYYSFTRWNGISKAAVFTGLDNFKQVFAPGSSFLTALAFTAKYTALFMVLTNVLAVALALVLVKKFRFSAVLRSGFFIPYIMSMTIVGFIWKFIFTSGFARFFEMTGFGFFNWSWLGDVRLAFVSVAFVGVWQSLGFYIVLYIAGLQAIPADVLEAATVDGATGARCFFRVTLPLLWPSVVTCVFMSLTNALKVFDIILALTRGGPGGATYSATLDIYREAFQNNNYGLGSAKALVFFVVVLVLTQLVLRLFRSRQID